MLHWEFFFSPTTNFKVHITECLAIPLSSLSHWWLCNYI